jgi:23S rRNA (uracil1939-C5)-methyltransferase
LSEKKSLSPPVDKGEIVEVEIADLSHDGAGVGSLRGFTLFVPDTVPGDLVEARITAINKGYAHALPVLIKQSSEYRTTPACQHFLCCGGCRLQHLKYSAQLLLKQKKVTEALRRLGQIGAPVHPVIGMSVPWIYRNTVQVPVASDHGQLIAGFYEKRSHKAMDIVTCPIQHPACFKAVSATRDLLRELKIAPYDHKTGRGVMRHIICRYSFHNNEVLILLVTKGEKLPQATKLADKLRSRIDNLAGVVQNVNSQRNNSVLGERDILLWGKPYLIEKLGGLSFHISPRSFFQINPAQSEVLLRKVVEFAGLSGKETVFDLYCGTGVIACNLARHAKQVFGVESSPQAVADAKVNASLNCINNLKFFHGQAEELLPQLVHEGYRADIMVVNPPRKGCAETLLKTIIQSSPARIIYVSCDPATLARDLKLLNSGGYHTIEVQPVDMFPHTSHVETVVLMSRAGV